MAHEWVIDDIVSTISNWDGGLDHLATEIKKQVEFYAYCVRVDCAKAVEDKLSNPAYPVWLSVVSERIQEEIKELK
jgi:hypothetical protein